MAQHTYSSSNDDSTFQALHGSVCNMVAVAKEKMILENIDASAEMMLTLPGATPQITAMDAIILQSLQTKAHDMTISDISLQPPSTATSDTTISDISLQPPSTVANDMIISDISLQPPSTATSDTTISEITLQPSSTATSDTTMSDISLQPPSTATSDTTISDTSLQPRSTATSDTTISDTSLQPPSTVANDMTISDISLQPPSSATSDTTISEITLQPSSTLANDMTISDISLQPPSTIANDMTISDISLQPPSTIASDTTIAKLSPPTIISDTVKTEISLQYPPIKTEISNSFPLIPIHDLATSSAISLQPSSSVVVTSDDEVQILCVTKKEPQTRLPIKIDSSDEEGMEIKDILVIRESEPEICKDISENIKAVSNSKNDEAGNNPKDLTCSICLSEFDNKAFLDQCFHAFCFYCILQWSEIVRTCPLCKALFTKIIHSVKSMTEYQQHRLPPKENPTKNTTTSSGRRFRYRTTLVNGRLSHNASATSSRPQNAWEQRAERRERLVAMKRRKSIRAKERRQSIYARNLWVQTVNQTGKRKSRNTSPQFFGANPACTHRLVPWLTRDLYCLLNEDKNHVDFILQLILSLISKISIDSQEFLEQLRPFLLDKTEHFCHEFLSFARSPFDMLTYDERAQYDWTRNDGEQIERTPMVVDMSTTGWDSPDEAQVPVIVPHSNEPGPSGLSSQQLNGWSTPILDAIELPINEVWSDVGEQRTNDVVELSPEVIDLVSPKERAHPNKHKRKHKHRYKHEHGKRVRYNENSEYLPIQRNSSVDVVILSSSHDSSPEDPLYSRDLNYYRSDDDSNRKSRHKGKHPTQNILSSSETLKSRDSSGDRSLDEAKSPNDRSDNDGHRKTRHKGKRPKQNFCSSFETLRSRDSSSDRSIDEVNGRKLRYKGKCSKKAGTRSRDKSSELSSNSQKHSRKHRQNNENAGRLFSSERNSKSCWISNGCLDMLSSSLSTKPSKPVVARPLSPTEDDMRQEIWDLEKKIAEDTNRLDELTKKQEQRKLLEMHYAATGSCLHNADSETDGQNR